MKNVFLYCMVVLVFVMNPVSAQTSVEANSNITSTQKMSFYHPWLGKRVGYIGDSITDPRNGGGKIKKYWEFLQEWLGITPYVYGVSGRQWDDVPRQAELLKNEHGDEVDAILVFIGTNDFNHGVPVGEWYTEAEEEVMFARGEKEKLVVRKKRTPIMSNETYKGRINIGITRLKELFPDKQIVLLTPLHRSFARFNETNVQPAECYQNRIGEYIDSYIDAIKEAGNIWGIPVIDFNAVTGINPMIKEQTSYMFNEDYDLLHPSTKGQVRMARTLMYQLLMYPCVFEE